MNRTRTRTLALAVVVALVVVAALGVAAAPAATRTPVKLVARVADPFSISLTKGGKKVTALKAGAYVIVVKDRAADHDFHITGPGLGKATSVSGTGTVTWKVTLRKGVYRYVCDPHASFMKGSFTVK